MLVSHQLWNNNVAEPDHRCSMYWWPVGHYLQGAGQAWSGQPGTLIQGISCFQVQPFVLSLQELVGCHYGQWSILSKSRASSGAVETASSHMQQQEQSLQDDHFCMGRAGSKLGWIQAQGWLSDASYRHVWGDADCNQSQATPIFSDVAKYLTSKITSMLAGKENGQVALGTESNVSVSIAGFSYTQLHNVVAPFDLHLVLLEGNLARQVLPFNILPGGVSFTRG
ncbi:unnamed protein product [Sphagnum balticum]